MRGCARREGLIIVPELRRALTAAGRRQAGSCVSLGRLTNHTASPTTRRLAAPVLCVSSSREGCPARAFGSRSRPAASPAVSAAAADRDDEDEDDDDFESDLASELGLGLLGGAGSALETSPAEGQQGSDDGEVDQHWERLMALGGSAAGRGAGGSGKGINSGGAAAVSSSSFLPPPSQRHVHLSSDELSGYFEAGDEENRSAGFDELLPEVEEIVLFETDEQRVRREAETTEEVARLRRAVEASDGGRRVQLLPHRLADDPRDRNTASEEMGADFLGPGREDLLDEVAPNLTQYPLTVRRWVVDALAQKGRYSDSGDWIPHVAQPIDTLLDSLGLSSPSSANERKSRSLGGGEGAVDKVARGELNDNYLKMDPLVAKTRLDKLRQEYENLPEDLKGGYRFGILPEEIEEADLPEKLRLNLSMAAASPRERKQFRIAQAVKKFGRKEGDTGSPEVQIAVMTLKAEELANHMTDNHKDKHNERRLKMLLSDRKKMMAYLKGQSVKRYYDCIQTLGLSDMVRAKTMWGV